MRSVIFLSLISTLFVQSSVQQNTTSTTLNVISVIPVSTATPTVTTNTNSTATPTDDVSAPVESVVLCTPGGSTGYGISWQPNMTSKAIVGTPFNVSWDWTVQVTKPPTYLDVYIQLFATGVTEKWKTQIAKVPSSPRWFMWTPEGLVDGKYKLRYVPDGKETFNIAANKLPCFSNGESVPFVSAIFSVSNSKGDLGSYNDPYSPNSATRFGSCNVLMLVSVVSVLLSFMFVL